MFKTILFPIDRSPESREAADQVIQLAKIHTSRVVLLSVLAEGSEDEDTEAADALLAGAVAMFKEQAIEAESLERTGKVAFTICDVADDIDAELIVMGSRGMGLSHEGASESTSHRVIDLAPCPVLIVP